MGGGDQLLQPSPANFQATCYFHLLFISNASYHFCICIYYLINKCPLRLLSAPNIYFIYICTEESERKGKTDSPLPSTDSFSKMPTVIETGRRTSARARNSLPLGWQTANFASHHLLPPMVLMSRKLETRVELGLKVGNLLQEDFDQ